MSEANGGVDSEDELACYEAAVQMDATNAAAHYNLALAMQVAPAGARGGRARARARRVRRRLTRRAVSRDARAERAPRHRQRRARVPRGAATRRARAVRDEAEAPFSSLKVLRCDAMHAPAHNNLGLILQRVRRDYPAAESAYRAAVAIAPEYAIAHTNLGFLLQDVKSDFDGAEREYRLAVRCDPSNAVAVGRLRDLEQRRVNAAAARGGRAAR